MATERVVAQQLAAPDRRPAAAVLARAPAAGAHAAERLQRRLGNQGAATFVARAATAVHGPDPVRADDAGALPPVPALAASAPIADATVASGASNGVRLAPPTPTAHAAAAAVARPGAAPPESASTDRAVPGAEAAPAPDSAPTGAVAAAPAATAPSAKAQEGQGGSATEGAADAAATKKPPSPREAIGPAIGAVRQRARISRRQSPPGVPVASAQAAAIIKGTEQRRGAATATVKNLDDASKNAKEVQREGFKAKFKAAIKEATPKPTTEAAANEVVERGATTASATMRGQLATQRDAAVGPLKSAAATDLPPSLQPAAATPTLQPEPLGPRPAPVSAVSVVPAPLPPERLDYSADRAPTDQAMAENNVSKAQLEKGNEPAFGQTLQARSTAEQHEAQAEAKYRKSEAAVQAGADKQAQGALARGLGEMHGARALGVVKVVGQQLGTNVKDQAERQRVTETIEGIKNQTRTDVEAILKEMETEASRIFGEGLTAAEKAYRDTFEEEKGGLGTWLTTWGDDWKDLIESSLEKARDEYLLQVDLAIDKVADCVDGKLEAAKKRVGKGQKQVDDFVEGLGDNVRKFGDDARQAVSTDFAAMSTQIDERGDALVNTLTAQFKESYERMSAMEEELRAANKSLWERVYDATIGLVKKILAFKDMLFSILAKAAGVIGDIISDPIGFLGNLVSGVMLGLKNFMGNIGAHLKKGLMDWLFGALGGAGLQLPDTFDLKGIISIVLQILGLTYANFRARAVAIVGEPVVAALEQAAEVFKVVVTEGIPGLWRFIKEKLEDLKSMVLDAIFDFIKEKVIIAGVTWVIGLLNPASAFFKACKAIYDIVMFFINRGSQILALVNAVIDSMAAIAKGSIGVAAKFVEDALAKAIPVAIGFLASLLGLGDISGTIRKTIEKAQAPVNKAIDWVINQAVTLVKAGGRLIAGAFGKKPEGKPAADGAGTELRRQVQLTLAERLKGKHTREEAAGVVNAVETEYRKLGLKSLDLGEENEEGVTPILAEASPKLPLADLLDAVPRPKGRSVVSKVQLELSAAVDVPATHLRAADPVRAGVTEGEGGGVAWTPSTKKVNVVTWNTSDVNPPGNTSHAEHQFVHYLESRPELWPHVERITMVNVTRSPCSTCGPELAGLLNSVKGARDGKPVSAEIFWTKLHSTGAQPTSWQSLHDMQTAGWRLNAPGDALPEKGPYANAVTVKLL